MSQAEDCEVYEWFPTEDASGRPCYVLFTDEDLAANPHLRTDREARHQFLVDEQRKREAPSLRPLCLPLQVP